MAQRRIGEFELELCKKDQAQVQQSVNSSGAEVKINIKLKWRKGKKALYKISNSFVGMMAAAVDGNSLYVMEWAKIHAYNMNTHTWSQLPDSSFKCCALAIVNNLLTFIGGRKDKIITHKLITLTRMGEVAKYTEEFPPMPTKRYGACALSTESALLVAGGQGKAGTAKLATTELLNTATLQWSTLVDLPQQTFGGSLLQIGGDTIYLLGAYDKLAHPIRSMYSCSLNALLQSRNPQLLGSCLTTSLSPSSVWRRECNLSAIDSAYVSLHDQLLAIGGKDSDDKPVKAVRLYNPSSNSWEIISHMATPRCECYAAVLPDNQLIVVGGFTGKGKTETVEIAASLE